MNKAYGWDEWLTDSHKIRLGASGLQLYEGAHGLKNESNERRIACS